MKVNIPKLCAAHGVLDGAALSSCWSARLREHHRSYELDRGGCGAVAAHSPSERKVAL